MWNLSEVSGRVDIPSWWLQPCRKCSFGFCPKGANGFLRTLFWGGDTFAPQLLVKDYRGADIPIQQFLQNTFLDMFEVLARAVGDLDGVLGFEVPSPWSFPITSANQACMQMLNEPHRGYIDLQSFHSWNYNTDLHLGHIRKEMQPRTADLI